MGRMIDADAFCDEMRHRQNECAKWRDETDDESIKTRADGALSAFIECKLTLEKMPTIEERKTGKWINNIHDIPICDQCGYMTPYDRAIDDYEYGTYCPNCGADMREQP